MARRCPGRLLAVAVSLLLVVVAPLAVAVWGTGSTGSAGPGGGAVVGWDRHVSQEAREFGADHPGWVDTMRWVTQFGTTWAVLVLVVPLAVVLFRAGRRRLACFVVVVPLTTPVLVEPLKWLVHRSRPGFGHQVPGYSFPSGHAAHVAAYVLVWGLVLVPAVARRMGDGNATARRVALAGLFAFGALVVLAVGVSRVALGAHYPSDVFAGWTVGTAWVAGMGAVAQSTRPKLPSSD